MIFFLSFGLNITVFSIKISRETLLQDKEIDVSAIVDCVLKESRKEEILYRISAIESLGTILSSLEIDKFEEVHNIMQSALTTKDKEENEDISSEEIAKNRGNVLKLKEVLYETLGKAWPENSKETQEKYREMFVDHCVSCLPNVTRSVQVCMMSALCSYVDKLLLLKEDNLSKSDVESLDKIVDKILQALRYSLSKKKLF